MKIETKYNIGDKVWIVYEAQTEYGLSGEVNIYDTEICNIVTGKEGLYYCCGDGNYTELKEEDIILYNEKDKLLDKKENLMQEIHKREEKENE